MLLRRAICALRPPQTRFLASLIPIDETTVPKPKAKKLSKKTQLSRKKQERSAVERQLFQNPRLVLMNASRLTEPELYAALKTVVQMPETRFRKMLSHTSQTGAALWDDVFVGELITRLPYFLTMTIIDIASTLQKYSAKHSGYVKSEQTTALWVALEREFIKRQTQFDNQKLLKVLNIMSLARRGSKAFYYEIQELLIDSELPLEANQLISAVQAYARVDMGSGIFYNNMVAHALGRLKNDFSLIQKINMAATMAPCTGVHAGCYGLMEHVDQELQDAIKHKSLYFHDVCRAAAALFPQNLGSNATQEALEERIFETYDESHPGHATELLKVAKQARGYFFSCMPLRNLIEKEIRNALDNQQIPRQQLQDLFWTVLREPGNPYTRQLKYDLLGRIQRPLASLKARSLAFVASGARNFYEDELQEEEAKVEQINARFRDFLIPLEKAVFIKQHQLKHPHDAVRLLDALLGVADAYQADNIFELLVSNVLANPQAVKYSDALLFFERLLGSLPHIAKRNLSPSLWRQFEESVFLPVLGQMGAGQLARLLDISLVVGTLSENFISELVSALMRRAYDFGKQHFARVASGLLELGGIQEFKKAMAPIVMDLLDLESGFNMLATQTLFDKKTRIPLTSLDEHARSLAVLHIVWSILVVRRMQPGSPVAARLFLAMDLQALKPHLANIQLDMLSAADFLKLAQVVQLAPQPRRRGKVQSNQLLTPEWLGAQRAKLPESVISRWLDQDRLSPSPQALEKLIKIAQNKASEGIVVKTRVLDVFNNQFHVLIEKPKKQLLAIVLQPDRLYLSPEEPYRKPLSQTIRSALIEENLKVFELKQASSTKEMEQILVEALEV